MDPKLLTEDGWKAITKKFPVKDTTVPKALHSYEVLKDEDYDGRFKSLTSLIGIANKAKGLPEIKPKPPLMKHVSDIVAAAQAEQKEITKAKAAAEKAELADAKSEAAQAKVKALEAKAEAEAARREDEQNKESEDEDEGGDFAEKLKKALNNLKAAKDPYYFQVCPAKPNCGVTISRQVIGSKHREELTKLTGGRTFLKPGRCRREGGTLIFDMDSPPAGLAAQLMKSIKAVTGLKFKVMVGGESAEDTEDVPVTGKPAVEAPLPPVSDRLAKAPAAWQATQRAVNASVKQLQAEVRKKLAGEDKTFVAEVEKSVTALDGLSAMLTDELSESLNRAIKARTRAERSSELADARTTAATYLKYLAGAGAAMLAHVDGNPFGVKTELRKTLTEGLTEITAAIAKPE